jgi:hypothetical protein
MKKILTVVLACVLLSLPAWAAAPAISAIAVTQTNSSTATVIWTTDIGGTSQVAYGIGNTSSVTPVDGSLVTSHSVTVTGLRPGVVYTYAVVSQNGSGQSTTSSTSTFGLCSSTSTGSGKTLATGNINLAYAYGPFTATLVNDSGSANTPTVCGNSVTSPVTGTIDSAGNFGASLPDVNLITPSPAHWSLNVKAFNGNVGSFTLSISPTGTTKDFTSALQTAASGQLQFVYYDPATATFDPSVSTSISNDWFPTTLNAPAGTASSQVSSPANTVRVFRVTLPYQVAVSKVVVNVTGAIAASAGDVGIYSSSGNRLTYTNAGLNTATSGALTANLVGGAVTLTPGVYYFAQCDTSASVTMTGTPAIPNTSMVPTGWGNAANLCTSGALPATLGVITNSTAAVPVVADFQP